mmetsp:Transcript_43364/g.70360  ORF Transcript_43364/g.70360 Transcript_43364/m.70360 type:complete len:287 (-) Transcript_43364:273-1133(-)|eukprot:CAMPEP_0184670616 /NCGR_PEP_ID=MMETSP0308-20130426/82937_1 /TAXON_ID=38269 /ORGANISM="Gloeochaete witrockiana, Strain SAG 46.84" /LENGTH=286 /DNA_ID=CAMNT_0027117417 /DNA_START=105 /DNA_END=962 /DNA_ORIENTATION=+
MATLYLLQLCKAGEDEPFASIDIYADEVIADTRDSILYKLPEVPQTFKFVYGGIPLNPVEEKSVLAKKLMPRATISYPADIQTKAQQAAKPTDAIKDSFLAHLRDDLKAMGYVCWFRETSLEILPPPAFLFEYMPSSTQVQGCGPVLKIECCPCLVFRVGNMTSKNQAMAWKIIFRRYETTSYLYNRQLQDICADLARAVHVLTSEGREKVQSTDDMHPIQDNQSTCGDSLIQGQCDPFVDLPQRSFPMATTTIRRNSKIVRKAASPIGAGPVLNRAYQELQSLKW